MRGRHISVRRRRTTLGMDFLKRSNGMASKRSTYFDVVKGIAIALMVLGHCIDQANGWAWVTSGASSHDGLWRVIASFHMPLFMLVSGYFYSHSLARHGAWRVLRQRALGLLVPSTLWSVLFIGLCYAVYYGLYDGVKTPQMHAYLYRPVPALWFLWALFFSSVVVAVVRLWAKDSPWVHGAIIVATLCLPNVLFSPEVFSVHPFFVLAYYIGQHRERVACWIEGRLRGIALVAIGLYALLYVGMDEATTVYVSKFSLWGKWGVGEMLYRDAYRWLLGALGSVVALIAVRVVSPLLQRTGAQRVLAYWGTVSLGIYGLNNILCMYPRLALWHVSPSLWRVLAVWGAMMLMSTIAMRVLSRWSWTNKWLLGKV